MSYMVGITDQSAELMRFLYSIRISNNQLVKNLLDEKVSFISRFYTPNIDVTNLSGKVATLIQESDADWVNNINSIDKKSLVYLLDQSDIKNNHNDLYSIFQTVILDAFSIGYAQGYDNSLYTYLSTDELDSLLVNISYLIDALENINISQYSDIILSLTNLYNNICSVKSNLSYLQNQQEIDSQTII